MSAVATIEARGDGGGRETTQNAAQAAQWSRKADAVAVAREIGWQVNDVRREAVMGFRLWTIQDDHGNMLTWRGVRVSSRG